MEILVTATATVCGIFCYLIGRLTNAKSENYFCWSNLKGSYQRIRDNVLKGWNDSDIWSLDHSIAVYCLPRLKLLKEKKHGIPSEIELTEEQSREIIDSKLSDKEKQDYHFQLQQENWNAILDKMIFSMECIVNDNEDIEQPDPEDCLVKHVFNPISDKPEFLSFDLEGAPENIKKYNEKMNEYSNELKAREEVIQEGLQLFATYFRGLWD
jgi:hypothetical protein